jgi:16S rRNA (cytidine1402-2'-O)-methyltransferase
MNEAVARRRKLAVVATPIGNLEDLSLRAARMLRNADLIAAEDTRSAHVLLNAVDAAVRSNPSSNESAGETSAGRRRVISLFEGNEAERSIEVIAAIDQGQSVVLIS